MNKQLKFVIWHDPKRSDYQWLVLLPTGREERFKAVQAIGCSVYAGSEWTERTDAGIVIYADWYGQTGTRTLFLGCGDDKTSVPLYDTGEVKYQELATLNPDAKIVDAAAAALVALTHLDKYPSLGSHNWPTSDKVYDGDE